MSATTLKGSCHCGNVRFELRSATDLAHLTARICRCGFCTRHGPRHWSDPNGELVYDVDDESELHRYTFGHATAQFCVCRRCGVYVFALSRIDGVEYGLINLNVVEGIDPWALATMPIEALSETVEERLARRARNWTSNVRREALTKEAS